MSELKVQVVCGFGIGTSTLLKIKIQNALSELGVKANVFTSGISSFEEHFCDVIFTSKDLSENIRERVQTPVVVINDFTDSKDIRIKLDEFLKACQR